MASRVELWTGPSCRSGEVDDTLASYSNYGPDIDIAAPGTCIASARRGRQRGHQIGNEHGDAACGRCGRNLPGDEPALPPRTKCASG